MNITYVETYLNLLTNGSECLEKVNNNCEMMNKESLKTASDELLDTYITTWLQHVCDRGDPSSGPILKKKAMLLSQKLSPSSTFKISMCTYE